MIYFPHLCDSLLEVC